MLLGQDWVRMSPQLSVTAFQWYSVSIVCVNAFSSYVGKYKLTHVFVLHHSVVKQTLLLADVHFY